MIIVFNSVNLRLIRVVIKKKLYFFFCFLLSLQVLFFAQVKLRFDHLSIQDGLSQASITSILQDSRGYMWFGTQDGLNRYNGYEFKVFKFNPADLSTISDNSILKVFEDSSNNLWIATLNGLNLYNRKTETFTRYFLKEGNNYNKMNQFSSIIEDNYSNLWIGSRWKGLIQFNLKTKKWIMYDNNKNNPNSLNNDQVLTLSKGYNNEIWIGTNGGGLNRYDHKIKKFTSYKNQPENPLSISNNIIRTIYIENKNKIWIGTQGGGLNIFNPEKNVFKKFVPDKPLDTRHPFYNWVSKIFIDSSNTVWVGNAFGGIIKIISFEEGKYINYRHNNLYKYSLSDDTINDIIEDKTGNIWIGTYLKGISILKKQKQQFSHFYINGNFKIINKANSFFEDANTLWYGTLGPLIKYDKNNVKTSRIKYFYPDNKKPASLSGTLINSIYRDVNNNLWVATNNGLNRFNDIDETFIKYLPDKTNKKTISGKYISCITEDAENNLWIGTYYGGLNRYFPFKDEFKRFKNDKTKHESIGSNNITSISNDYKNKDILWIGLNAKGLDRFDSKTGKFKHFVNIHEDRNSISSNFVLSVFTSEAYPSIIWVGTWGGGLNKYNTKTDKWTLYTEKNGLCNNTVYGILEDSNNNLWLSSINGLSMFNPIIEKFNNYYVEDGLQSNEFNMNAFHKGKSGNLYFGGINGFTIFKPEKIKKNNCIPRIVLTSFKKFNKEFKTKPVISELDKIVLTYYDNVFSFEFASLDYNNPKKNKYSYKLEGFSKEWIDVDASERVANFTNIPHGKYIFRVKGTNNDEIWNERGTSIRLIILPPFWQTLWFKTLIFFIAFVGVYYIHRNRTKRLTIKLERENKINSLCIDYGITKREKEILDLLLSGKSNNDIVEILPISLGTVKSHIHSIYTKAGVKKRNELYIRFSEL